MMVFSGAWIGYGRVAELVDALASGASELRLVEVQVLFRPPNHKQRVLSYWL